MRTFCIATCKVAYGSSRVELKHDHEGTAGRRLSPIWQKGSLFAFADCLDSITKLQRGESGETPIVRAAERTLGVSNRV